MVGSMAVMIEEVDGHQDSRILTLPILSIYTE